MNNKAKYLVAGMAALAMVAAAEPAHADKKEKCYGIAKAGKNDCAAADGSHSCATYAKRNGYGQDWIGLSEGVCDRILGASPTPTAAEGAFATKEELQKR